MRKLKITTLSTGTPILFALAMRIASVPTANLSYLVLAIYALLGRQQAIHALGLSWLFTMISPGIAPDATLGAIGRYAVILSAATSIILRSWEQNNSFRINKTVLATLLLGLILVVHSLLFSPIPDVSLLKAASWLLTMIALISAWSRLSTDERDQLIQQIFTGLTVLMFLSLPLIFMPIGYLRNGTGFQGLLNHPQAFGPTMALLGAWISSKMMAQKKPQWSLVVIASLCFVMILLSEARTAGLALVLGVGTALFIAPAMAGQSPKAMIPGLRSRRIHLVAGFAFIGFLIASTHIESVVTNYLSKSGRAASANLIEAYDGSRGRLIQNMWDNIKEKPLQGIGFGIASHLEEMEIERDPLIGLPISASIEKGVLPIAIQEELGLIGFLAVIAWLLMALRRASLGGLVPTSIALTVLILNMGESTFFSPGGLGLLMMVLFGWAVSTNKKKTSTA